MRLASVSKYSKPLPFALRLYPRRSSLTWYRPASFAAAAGLLTLFPLIAIRLLVVAVELAEGRFIDPKETFSLLLPVRSTPAR
jgi:hypothetical protein